MRQFPRLAWVRPEGRRAPTAAGKPSGDPLVEWLMSIGIPVTRENYIEQNWPGEDMPDEWTGEHEAQLPEELRDWSQVKQLEA